MMLNVNDIFELSAENFNEMALSVFREQAQHVEIYQKFIQYLSIDIKKITHYTQIPFLPISFFKSHKIIHSTKKEELIFSSSGTTGMTTSKHYVAKKQVYEQSFNTAFKHFFGDPKQYCILALLPSYLERKGSSLVYMTEQLIADSQHKKSGFYLYDYKNLAETLQNLEETGQKTILLGVSFALLDFAESHPMKLQNTLIMETGGMKGKRKELIREELHAILKKSFGLEKIHSEYGMTELLSQAYSKGDGIFECPPFMKILIADPSDPLHLLEKGKSGLINIIDLANIYSCSFLATNDLGKVHQNNTFEVLGRMDFSDIRGCNLLVH